MEEKAGSIIRVRISNQQLSIRGDKDEKYIHQLADYVDRKMREVSQGTSTVDTLRVALLAALNIADECFQLKQKMSETDKLVGQKALQCVSVLEQILN